MRSCAKRWREGDRYRRFATIAVACFVRTGWGATKDGQLRVLCYQYGGESESGLKPIGSADNWRCVALDKLRSVEVLNGVANRAYPRTSGIP
jgi:hypothetical protein